jgi:hypothetical protein
MSSQDLYDAAGRLRSEAAHRQRAGRRAAALWTIREFTRGLITEFDTLTSEF